MTIAAEVVSTPLLIGGEERPGSAGAFPVYDPARSGAIIGYAASASPDDARAAVAAAEAAWPAWAAMTAAERSAHRARRRSTGSRPTPTSAPSCCPARTARSGSRPSIDLRGLRRPVPPGGAVRARAGHRRAHRRARRSARPISRLPRGVVSDHLPVQLAAGHPRGVPARRADVRQHGDGEAAADRAAVVRADAAAPGPGAAAGRAQRGHRGRRGGRPGRGRRPADQARLLHRLGRRRQADHGDGRGQRHQRDPRARRQRPGPGARRRGPRRGGVRPDERRRRS